VRTHCIDSEAVSVAEAKASCVRRANLPTKLPYVAATQTKTGTVPMMSNVSFHDIANITIKAPIIVALNLSPIDILVVTAFFNTSVSDANRLTNSPDFVVSKKEISCFIKWENNFFLILTTTLSPARLYNHPRNIAKMPPKNKDENSKMAATCNVVCLYVNISEAVELVVIGLALEKKRTTARPGPTARPDSLPSEDNESMIAPKNMGMVKVSPAAKINATVAMDKMGTSCFACANTREMDGILIFSLDLESSLDLLPLRPLLRFLSARDTPLVDMGRFLPLNLPTAEVDRAIYIYMDNKTQPRKQEVTPSKY
jgi:hypothetical protein